MGTAADSVGLTKQAGEVLVEVAEAVYTEVVHPQAFGVGAGPGDPGIFYAPGKVKVSAQRLPTQAGSPGRPGTRSSGPRHAKTR